MFCRKAAAFALALLLICVSPGQAFAAMPMMPEPPEYAPESPLEENLMEGDPLGENSAAGDFMGEPPIEGTPTEGDPAEEEEPAEGISSFEDLRNWLEEHRESGGRAYLQNDVTVPADTVYQISAWAGDAVSYLDTGAFTIYVQGRLELLSCLEIFGEGGADGVIHVEPNGYLQITVPDTGSDRGEVSILPVTAQKGYAIYQDEGAFLQVDTEAVTLDTIQLAQRPVVWPTYDSAYYEGELEHIPVVVLPLEGGDIADLLPQTSAGYFCKDAAYDDQNMQDVPVIWNIEQHAADFAAGRRFVLTGQYAADVDVYRAQPACLVVFQWEQAPVFLQGLAAPGKWGKPTFHFIVHQNDPDATYRLEYSTDNESWQSAEDYLYIEDQWDNYLEYQGVVGKTDVLPRFFSVAATDSAGKTIYSDTIEVMWDDTIAGLDNGGGRNGETAPGDPGDAELPPSTISPPEETTPPPENPEPPEETTPPSQSGDSNPPEPPETTTPPPENLESPQGTTPPLENLESSEETTPPPQNDSDMGDEGQELVEGVAPGVSPIFTPSPQQTQGESKEAPTSEHPSIAASGAPAGDLAQPESLPENTAPPVQPAEAPTEAGVNQPVASEEEPASAVPRSPLSPGAQIVAASGAIALIGAPVYLAPRWKKWFPRGRR